MRVLRHFVVAVVFVVLVMGDSGGGVHATSATQTRPGVDSNASKHHTLQVVRTRLRRPHHSPLSYPFDAVAAYDRFSVGIFGRCRDKRLSRRILANLWPANLGYFLRAEAGDGAHVGANFVGARDRDGAHVLSEDGCHDVRYGDDVCLARFGEQGDHDEEAK